MGTAPAALGGNGVKAKFFRHVSCPVRYRFTKQEGSVLCLLA
jgi:hypothetical protein